MKTYSAVIIEDEAMYREHLTELLQNGFPEIKLLKTCCSGEEALQQLPLLAPDVVFMDIDLGDMNAFDVIGQLNLSRTRLIFTTAYTNWAAQAFQVNALHFLLKPITKPDLREAIDRLEERHPAVEVKELLANMHQFTHQTLAIREKKAIQYLIIADILFLEADESYTKIFYLKKEDVASITTSQGLLYFEEELQKHGFLRINKKYLVNSQYINSYNRTDSTAELSSGHLLPVSRSKRYLFM
ncbi:MAG: LytTR family DNA-binding domain-containing protein [Bacteroidales bacterium]|nr:LytTR family DNA-binding domain-containing protein [Bacteroidales bacterium]